MDIMQMGKNPNFLGSWDLYDMPNQKIQVTISKIQDEEIVGQQGKSEGATVCHFAEDIKPMILNLTNKKTLSRLFKTKESNKLIGKRIEVGYEKVKAFGKISDALRISNTLISQQAQPQQKVELPKCKKCTQDITAAHGMTPEQVAAYTEANYGEQLCGKCAAEIKKNKETENETN